MTIGGKAAFVDFISPMQVNAQVPTGAGTGSQQLQVTTPTGTSSPLALTVEAVKPGLLAPPAFRVGGTQDVVGLFPDSVTYVLPPGAIPGIPSRRAKAGDTITFYGVGFGTVNPNILPGQVARQLSSLAAPFTVSFGSADAKVSYCGLVPNFVGLYQFNVVVPAVAGSDTVPFTIQAERRERCAKSFDSREELR